MALLNFMAVAPPSAAKAPRSAACRAPSPSVEAVAPEGAAAGFGATLAAVRGRQNRQTANSPIRKIDKPAEIKEEQPSSSHSGDGKLVESHPNPSTTSDTTSEVPSNSDPQKNSTNDAPDAAGKTPDGSQAVSTATQGATPTTPDSSNSPTDASAAPENGPKVPEPPPQSALISTVVAVRPEDAKAADNAPSIQGKQTPQTTSDNPSSADNPTAANADHSSAPVPTPPLLADQEGKKAHEKTAHAAHAPMLESDSPPSETLPVPVAGNAPDLAALTPALAGQTAAQLPMKEAQPPGTPGMPLSLLPGNPGSPNVAGADLAPPAQESLPAPTPDPFDQVVLGLKGKLDARTGKAEIRLDPPNLGTVKVSVTLDNGILTAEFHSASSVVRDLLKGNLEQLKTALQSQGVAVDRLAVDAPPNAGATGQNPQASFGSATHDGRSAGHYQDPRDGRPRSAGDGFARLFSQAQEAPLDLVA